MRKKVAKPDTSLEEVNLDFTGGELFIDLPIEADRERVLSLQKIIRGQWRRRLSAILQVVLDPKELKKKSLDSNEDEKPMIDLGFDGRKDVVGIQKTEFRKAMEEHDFRCPDAVIVREVNYLVEKHGVVIPKFPYPIDAALSKQMMSARGRIQAALGFLEKIEPSEGAEQATETEKAAESHVEKPAEIPSEKPEPVVTEPVQDEARNLEAVFNEQDVGTAAAALVDALRKSVQNHYGEAIVEANKEADRVIANCEKAKKGLAGLADSYNKLVNSLEEFLGEKTERSSR